MTVCDAIITGLFALAGIGISVFFYMWRENWKFLREKKIEVYSTYISIYWEWLYAYKEKSEKKIESIDKKLVKELNLALSNILFYGSDDIYKKIRESQEKEYVTGEDFNKIIFSMSKEINKKKNIDIKNIFRF